MARHFLNLLSVCLMATCFLSAGTKPKVYKWECETGGQWNQKRCWKPKRVPNGPNIKTFFPGINRKPICVTLNNSVVVGEMEIDSFHPYRFAASRDSYIFFRARDGAKVHVKGCNHAFDVGLMLDTELTFDIYDGAHLALHRDLKGNYPLLKSGRGSLELCGFNCLNHMIITEGALEVSSVGALGQADLLFVGGDLVARKSFYLDNRVVFSQIARFIAEKDKFMAITGELRGTAPLHLTGEGDIYWDTLMNVATSPITLKDGRSIICKSGAMGFGVVIMDSGEFHINNGVEVRNNIYFKEGIQQIVVHECAHIELSGHLHGPGLLRSTGGGSMDLRKTSVDLSVHEMVGTAADCSSKDNLASSQRLRSRARMKIRDSIETSSEIAILDQGVIEVDEDKTLELSTLMLGEGQLRLEGKGMLYARSGATLDSIRIVEANFMAPAEELNSDIDLEMGNLVFKQDTEQNYPRELRGTGFLEVRGAPVYMSMREIWLDVGLYKVINSEIFPADYQDIAE